jgi:hypothetical protein
VKNGARLASLVAWSGCGLSIVLAAIGWALFLMSGHVPDSAHGDHGMDPIIATAFVGLATVGALLVSRQPGNAVSWLLWTLGVSTLLATNGIGYGYVAYAVERSTPALPGAAWVAWLTNWVNTVGFVGLGVLCIIFPTGRVASRRWQPVLRGAILVAAVIGLEEALRPGPISYFPFLDNPLTHGGPSPIVTVALVTANAIVPAAMLVGAVSVLARFRHSRGVERQQIKWVAYAVTLVAGYFSLMGLMSSVIWDIPPNSPVNRAIGGGWALAVSSVPLALGVAILRYNLYAIDRIINRTLVYGVLSVCLALAYWGCVVVLQQIVRPITSGSDLAIVGSTLAVAALFQPLRSRIQQAVDRRFYRERYDAARTLEAFGSRLRDEVDLDSLSTELLEVVKRTIEPARVSLWLRPSVPERRSQ